MGALLSWRIENGLGLGWKQAGEELGLRAQRFS